MKAERAALIGFVLVALMLSWKLVRPYPIPPAQQILPPPLPVISPVPGNDVLSLIRQHNIWSEKREGLKSPAGSGDSTASGDSAAAAAATAAAVDTHWRLVGVSTEGLQELAVIDSHLGMRSMQVGETLPDGSTITQIMAFGIQIKRSGKDESVYLFGKL